MRMVWNDRRNAWRFEDGANCFWMTHEEAQFVVNTLRRQKWRYKIMDQIEYDEDNLDFSETTREEFIDLCFEEIDSNIGIYGDDWEPTIEDIVFDVANENEIWRD